MSFILKSRNRFAVLILCAALISPQAGAEGLPDLGDASESAFSLAQEREIGEEIMRQIRSDPAFLDDAEITQYLNDLGYRLESRQSLTFFGVRDPTINAFALPGGFIGVHTGLIASSLTESELASVLSHEIAHVTQRHIARLISSQKKSTIISLAALAVAVLASRSNSQISQAGVATAQATAIQSQLNFTREHEREADRIGLQILQQAGFDARAMPAFFERLQRGTRALETSTSAPAYLRTHPLTFERIADVESRIQGLDAKQSVDSLDFHLVRAKLKANHETPRDAIAYFEQNVQQRKFAAEAGSRYGLVVALMRQKNIGRAEKEMASLREIAPPNPMIENLAAQVKTAAGKKDEAVAIYRNAHGKFPESKVLTYNYAESLLHARSSEKALEVVEDQLELYPDDARLYLLRAQSYAAQNKRLLQHQSQAEAYVRLGSLPQAIEQLQIALRAGDGDFYELSQVEARLNQLRALEAESRKP
ncbi:MAG: M48 family metalloprotease [Burkholderiales bacterium]